MTSRNPTLKEIRRISRPILKEHGVEKAEIFGSYARQEQDQKSDIDIIIEPRDGATLADIANLKQELKEALDKEVDLLTYDSLSPEIRDNVFSEALEI